MEEDPQPLSSHEFLTNIEEIRSIHSDALKSQQLNKLKRQKTQQSS